MPTLNRRSHASANLIVKSNIPDYNPDEPSPRYYPYHMDLSTLLPLDWPRKGVKKSFRFIPFFFFSFLSLSLVSCIDYFIRSICLCFRRINKNSRMIPAALLPGENRKFAYSLFPQWPVVFIWDSKLRKMEQGCFYPVS